MAKSAAHQFFTVSHYSGSAGGLGVHNKIKCLEHSHVFWHGTDTNMAWVTTELMPSVDAI